MKSDEKAVIWIEGISHRAKIFFNNVEISKRLKTKERECYFNVTKLIQNGSNTLIV